MNTTKTFTPDEQRALDAAVKSSASNGHDFGFTEDIVAALRPMKKQAIGALITSLQRKGVFDEVCAPIRTDSGTWTQFVLAEEHRA